MLKPFSRRRKNPGDDRASGPLLPMLLLTQAAVTDTDVRHDQDSATRAGGKV